MMRKVIINTVENNLISIADYSVYIGELKFTNNSNYCAVINCINPHSYVVALSNDRFKLALLNSDVLIPDGEGIVLASYLLESKHIKKISGMDVQMYFLNKLEQNHGKCFYMGSHPSTIKKIKETIKQRFPHVQVDGISPSYYTDKMPESENQKIIDRIKSFAPNVLFVGLGTCKQETWINENASKLDGFVSYACGIGAAFGFLCGTHKRAPKIMISLKLEWLDRLIRNPFRLWRRNFVSSPLFVCEMVKLKVSQVVHKIHL